jgi:hypothetical protein
VIRVFPSIPQNMREWATWIASIETQGEFTGTLTGYASLPTGDVVWTKLGRRVTIYNPTSILGTSNATTLTMTGVPSSITPATGGKHCPVILIDNGVVVSGLANITSTVITYYMGSPLTTSGFTGSGSKGLFAGCMLSWVLDT